MWQEAEMKTNYIPPWGGGGETPILLNLTIFFVCIGMLMTLCP